VTAEKARSAGGHDEQPWLVKISTTARALPAWAWAAKTAVLARSVAKMDVRRMM
jgi:hypothetical protein